MKKILLTILLILICGAAFSLGITTYENIAVNDMLANFAAKGIEVGRDQTYIYYEIPNENAATEYSAFSDNTKSALGQPGDIITALGSNFPDMPLLNLFIDHYFGFHAALVIRKNAVAEAVITSVNTPDDIMFNALWPREEPFPTDIYGRTGIVRTNRNYFLNKIYGDDGYYSGFYSYGIVGLRVKGITDGDRLKVVDIADDIINSKQIYNYLYFINNQKGYYCTSFIKEAFERLQPENRQDPYSIDNDSFTSSIDDFILSRDVYIFSYFRVNEDGMGEIYYLAGDKVWNQ